MTINKHTTETDISNIYAKTCLEFSPSIRLQRNGEEVEKKLRELEKALEVRLGKDSNYQSVMKAAVESVSDEFYRILIRYKCTFYDYEAILLRLDTLVRAGAKIG